jgi:hypothetical protein
MLRNMKKIIVLLIIVISNACAVAQNPPVLRTLPARIKLTQEGFDAKPGDYYKDLDNELDKYVGTWVYDDGNGTVFTLNLRKVEMFYTAGTNYRYTDKIIVTYKLIKNYELLVDNLSLPELNTLENTPSSINCKYGLYGLSVANNTIDGFITDLTLDIIRTSEIKYLPQPSGNPKIKFSIFSASALRKQPKEFYVGKPQTILPNNVILTKI